MLGLRNLLLGHIASQAQFAAADELLLHEHTVLLGQPERQGDERNYQKYLDRVEQMRGDIARTEANIASVKRELTQLRD